MYGQKPEIVEKLRDFGFALTQKGRRLWMCCPFHAEKTSSFMVDAEKQLFYCFGCHEKGDVISFVMKLNNVSFRDALSILGIARRRLPSVGAEDFQPLQSETESERGRKLIEAFYTWCREFRHEMYELLDVVGRIDRQIKDPAYLDVQTIADVYLAREIADHYICVLTGYAARDESMQAALALYKTYQSPIGVWDKNG